MTGNQVGGAVQITGNQSGPSCAATTPSPAHFSARITACQSPTAIRAASLADQCVALTVRVFMPMVAR
ncbi:MAG: hypothetical protein R2856_32465 [Caldilineaceae bacterium]